MARTNPTFRALSRILDRSETLVYLVDQQDEILFANQALANWVGSEVDAIRNVRLAYGASSGKDGVEHRLNGLCPPPAAGRINGDVEQFWIFADPAGGPREYCLAAAHPILDDLGQPTLLVAADPGTRTDAAGTSGEPVSGQPGSHRLHVALAAIREQLAQHFAFESLVGNSPFARRIRRQAQIVTASEADVLIQGPAGSGKEHLARAMFLGTDPEHANLIPIHCPIADPVMIQQTIADASDPRRGDQNSRFALLLIDVDRLRPDAQAELLGFLELPNFQCRTFATSAESLLAIAAAGNFSQRLAFRLSSLTMDMVALTERRQDIPFLAQAFLEAGNSDRHRQLKGFRNSVMEQLLEFDWPDNLNQLNRTVREAAKRCTTDVIAEADLPESFLRALEAMRIGQASVNEIDLDSYLASIERELILRAIHQARGNKTRAAKLLSVSRPKLLRRLRVLGLGEFIESSSADDSEQLDPSAFEELNE